MWNRPPRPGTRQRGLKADSRAPPAERAETTLEPPTSRYSVPLWRVLARPEVHARSRAGLLSEVSLEEVSLGRLFARPLKFAPFRSIRQLNPSPPPGRALTARPLLLWLHARRLILKLLPFLSRLVILPVNHVRVSLFRRPYRPVSQARGHRDERHRLANRRDVCIWLGRVEDWALRAASSGHWRGTAPGSQFTGLGVLVKVR
jgi:hypothetical protein